mmetsp:Transcript_2492/g.6222  ORF Transcript_2492/g.6222 Transcript_2492/m.6222 type:complete len:203 (+) Transcript_2492:1204-1812(+)
MTSFLIFRAKPTAARACARSIPAFHQARKHLMKWHRVSIFPTKRKQRFIWISSWWSAFVARRQAMKKVWIIFRALTWRMTIRMRSRALIFSCFSCSFAAKMASRANRNCSAKASSCLWTSSCSRRLGSSITMERQKRTQVDNVIRSSCWMNRMVERWTLFIAFAAFNIWAWTWLPHRMTMAPSKSLLSFSTQTIIAFSELWV